MQFMRNERKKAIASEAAAWKNGKERRAKVKSDKNKIYVQYFFVPFCVFFLLNNLSPLLASTTEHTHKKERQTETLILGMSQKGNFCRILCCCYCYWMLFILPIIISHLQHIMCHFDLDFPLRLSSYFQQRKIIALCVSKKNK